MSKSISFRLVAFTDPAGKYDSKAYRNGNEDNFFVDDDLSDDKFTKVPQDQVLKLGEEGMLMCVADGMGGMNAGEVASQIAIDTVKEYFEKDKLTKEIWENPVSRKDYLEKVIKIADKSIKDAAKKDPSKDGMGSTLLLGWLCGDELTISWIGDSRAYIFNDKSGIRLISRDHSYVQELVNKGMLTYEQTFDHPQNNIITRSLGDTNQAAKPESKTVKVGKGDIILLCSDGLSGVLRDRKGFYSDGRPYPEENIEDIIKANCDSMKGCREALWKAAENGGWYDNVTAILCQVVEGPESPWTGKYVENTNNNKRFNFGLLQIIMCLFWIGTIVAAFFIGRATVYSNPIENEITGMPEDTIINEPEIDVINQPEYPTEEIENPSDVVSQETKTKKNNSKENHKSKSTIQEKVEEKAKGKTEEELTAIPDKELTPIQNQ